MARTSGGELLLAARLEVDASGDPRLRVEVADTGCGIPPENLQLVQEPFFTTKPHGNGLGLSICRSIVWHAGGEVGV